MRRILVAIDDYNEMIYLEAFLKKMGFDCMGVQKENLIPEIQLTFAPELLIATAVGRKVNGLRIAKKLRRVRGLPKVMLLLGQGQEVSDQECQECGVNAVLHSPVVPRDLLTAIAQVGGMDVGPLIKKLEKLESSDHRAPAEGERPVRKGFEKETPVVIRERQARWEAALKALPSPKVNEMDHNQVKAQVLDFRAREGDPEIHSIDDERRRFVEGLFRVGSGKKS